MKEAWSSGVKNFSAYFQSTQNQQVSRIFLNYFTKILH